MCGVCRYCSDRVPGHDACCLSVWTLLLQPSGHVLCCWKDHQGTGSVHYFACLFLWQCIHVIQMSWKSAFQMLLFYGFCWILWPSKWCNIWTSIRAVILLTSSSLLPLLSSGGGLLWEERDGSGGGGEMAGSYTGVWQWGVDWRLGDGGLRAQPTLDQLYSPATDSYCDCTLGSTHVNLCITDFCKRTFGLILLLNCLFLLFLLSKSCVLEYFTFSKYWYFLRFKFPSEVQKFPLQ